MMAADSRTVLLTGATGYLGRYLGRSLRRAGVSPVTTARSGAGHDLDLADHGELEAALARWRPAVIVHAGAMSSVAACAQDPERAGAVNAGAVAVLAQAAARLVYVSTDMVFDGTAAPYAVDARPEPLSVYGETKAAGEAAALEAGGVVVRIPLLFGKSHDGRRGATDMIRGSAGPVCLFSNEYRTPLHVADAAGGIADLALGSDRTGIVHLAGADRLSRYEFGRRFVQIAGLPAQHVIAAINTDAARPPDASLIADAEFHPRPLARALADS